MSIKLFSNLFVVYKHVPTLVGQADSAKASNADMQSL